MAITDLKPEELIQISQMNIVSNGLFYSKFLETVVYEDKDPELTAYTDGNKVAIGPYVINNIDNLSQLNFVMAHEALHIVLGHCVKEIRLKADNQTLLNIVMDIIINTILIDDKYKSSYGLSDVKTEKINFGLHPNISFANCSWQTLYQQGLTQVQNATPGIPIKIRFTNDKYQSWLTDPITIQENGYSISGPPSTSSNGGKSDSQTTTSSGDNGSNGDIFVPNPGNEMSENSLSEALHEALNVCQSYGINPGNLQEMIESKYEKNINWKLALRQKMKKFINKRISTYEKPKKTLLHTGVILPDTTKKKYRQKDTPPIRIFWDTSGSLVSSSDIILGDINNLCKEFKVEGEIFFWDTKLYKETMPLQDYNTNKTKFEIKGGGGTNVSPVIKYINEHKKDKVLNIIITDGYFSHTHLTNETSQELIWIIVGRSEPIKIVEELSENLRTNQGKHFIISAKI